MRSRPQVQFPLKSVSARKCSLKENLWVHCTHTNKDPALKTGRGLFINNVWQKEGSVV